MKRRISAALAVCLLALSVAANAQSWKIPYGSEKGKVAVYNSKTDPKFAEDAPYGPMAFRVHNENLWVLDSIGGRIYGFDQKNELKTDVTVSGLEGFKLLEDFALVSGASGRPESAWVADAANCDIRKISLADGKELLRIGGRGSEPGKFMQINQLEVDAGGRLYVGDYGRTVISVFTAYGGWFAKSRGSAPALPSTGKGSCICLSGAKRAVISIGSIRPVVSCSRACMSVLPTCRMPGSGALLPMTVCWCHSFLPEVSRALCSFSKSPKRPGSIAGFLLCRPLR